MLLRIVQWRRAHSAHRDLDILVLKLRCNKHSASTERPTLRLVKEEPHFSNTYMSKRENKSWSKVSTRPGVKNDCAGEGQQQFYRPWTLVVICLISPLLLSPHCPLYVRMNHFKEPTSDCHTRNNTEPPPHPPFIKTCDRSDIFPRPFHVTHIYVLSSSNLFWSLLNDLMIGKDVLSVGVNRKRLEESVMASVTSNVLKEFSDIWFSV
jgi:hypothetical protein